MIDDIKARAKLLWPRSQVLFKKYWLVGITWILAGALAGFLLTVMF